MSTAAWSDLNKDCNILKLHDKFPIPKCNYQKSLLLRHSRICLKVMDLKILRKKYLRVPNSMELILEAGVEYSRSLYRNGCWC